MLDGLKTYIGATVVLVAEMSRMFGIELGDTEGITESIMTILGVVMVYYGRFKAKPRE